MALRNTTGIPRDDPVRIGLLVIAAGDELADGFGKPECLAAVSCHGHRAPVLDRDREHLVEAKSQEIDRLRKFVSDLGDDQLSDASR